MKELHPTAIVRSAADLRIMAAEVKSDIKQGDESRKKGIQDYRRAGERLLKAKVTLGHGMFGKWIKDHFEQSERQLQRYMKLANTSLTSDLESEWIAILGNAKSPEDETGEDDEEEADEEDEADDGGGVAEGGSGDQGGVASGGDVDEESESSQAEGEGASDADETELTDFAGVVVPEVARPAFLKAAELKVVGRDLDAVRKTIKEICDGPAGRLIQFEDVSQHISNAKRGVLQSMPTHVCPLCAGKNKNCQCCKGNGWTVEHVYKRIMAETK